MTKKPRLLIFWAGGYERAGGIGRVMGNLIAANDAAERPYVTRVLDTRGPYSIHVSPAFFALALSRLTAAALAGHPVAAHVNMAHKGSTVRKVIVCRLLRALRVPYLLHLHANNYDSYFDRQPKWAQEAIRGVFTHASRIVVLGTLWEDCVVRQIGADPRKVVTIRNGVPDPGARVADPAADEVPLIVFLSNLLPWKGLDELLRALGTPPLRGRRWRLVAAGEGDPAPYQATANRLGIGERVEFPGWVSRPRAQELLRSAAILALPSHIEGLSVTLVEGLAHGVPVIATPVGAHPDILRDRENAMVVPAADAGALAEALLALFTDPELAARVAAGGRALFEECLEIGTMEAAFDALWRDLLEQAKPRRWGSAEPVASLRP